MQQKGRASLSTSRLPLQARSTVGAGSEDLEIGSGVFSEKHNRGYNPLLYKAKEGGEMAEGGLLLGEAERKARNPVPFSRNKSRIVSLTLLGSTIRERLVSNIREEPQTPVKKMALFLSKPFRASLGSDEAEVQKINIYL